ncbi:MAG TPA: acyloxyacyl hydrolase [Magnetospirillaceae bacterium]|jgi:hypothetical protein
MSAAQRAKTILLCTIFFFAFDRIAFAQSSDDGLTIMGDGPDYVGIGAGSFNIQGHSDQSPTGEMNVEVRGGKKLWDIGPAVGILGNFDGGLYGYVGGYADIGLGPIVVTPLAAVGAYSSGGGQYLGGVFQFRLAIDAAYQFDGGSRLGVEFAHLSNATIDDRNPGENELLLTYAMPVDLGL